ncbi:MAG: glycosyltransferase family 2 protein [Coraliomargaritaceae bacterium]
MDKSSETYNKFSCEKEIKVSVIVPAYNVDEYIYDCLKSIVEQTLREIEIIVINDASTDSTSKIIEQYRNNDPRVIAIENTINLGVAESRNIGLKLARGKYIKVIDSDDFLSKDALATLHAEAEKSNAEIVFHDAYTILNGREPKLLSYPDSEKNLDGMCGGQAWWYLFEKSIINHHQDVIFTAHAHPHEDTVFSFKLFSRARSSSYIKQPLIYYRIHDSGIMSQIGQGKKIDQHKNSAALCAEDLINFYKNNSSLFAGKIERKQVFIGLLKYFVREAPKGACPIARRYIRKMILLEILFKKKVTKSNKLLIKIFKIPVLRLSYKAY